LDCWGEILELSVIV